MKNLLASTLAAMTVEGLFNFGTETQLHESAEEENLVLLKRNEEVGFIVVMSNKYIETCEKQAQEITDY